MKKILLLCTILTPWLVAAQSNFKATKANSGSIAIDRSDIKPMKNVKAKVPRAVDPLRSLQNIEYYSANKLNLKNTYELVRSNEGEVIALSGKPTLKSEQFAEKCQEYLVETAKYWGVADPIHELLVSKTDIDGDEQHLTYTQQYKGIKIWNAELKLHAKNEEIYYSNGRLATLNDVDVVPTLSASASTEVAQADLAKTISIKVLSPEELVLTGTLPKEELILYKAPELGSTYKLAYHTTVFPNVTDRWEYFVDAKTGAILYKYRNTCKFNHGVSCSGHTEHQQEISGTSNIATGNTMVDGPETGTGLDLLNVNRSVKSYRVGSTNYLIDATKTMFKSSASSMPNDPVGALWTLTAFNTSPQGNSFKYDHVTSANANLNNPTAVSAHYNASLAYDYFSTTFGRNSIDGKGGTIISLINVADEGGGGMDNAFWNGEAMFYGNGASAFRPLARGLDVAGHEMTHGVVQSSANLEYQGESGALNESFADIFGAMIDRNDWQMGEDVVKTSAFPSGALRDLSNPHNGGTSLSSPGYQPQHYSERYTGSQDNGGVHINSGIPNFAFFKFASASAVGKNFAEQAFYRALTKYLVKSSRFVDLRAAVIQSIKDLNYGATVENAAAAAFDAVGIPGSGGGSGGSGTNGNYQNDLPINPGNDIIVLNDAAVTKIYLTNPAGSPITVLSNTAPISNVSASDDGSELIFVGKDKKIYYLFIDWSLGTVDQQVLQDQPIWRNAVISKDGFRVAALLDQLDNKLDIYDFDQELWNTYTLVNPTTGQGVNTDEVEYAGSLEWDYSGKYVIYDASNQLKGGIFGSINYWDVGIIRAFDPKAIKFGDGQIIKLFSDLPEGISIGNPTFAKNSPYIIGFDLLDENTNKWSIYGVNSQTGVNNTIAAGNTVPGFPSYSRDDKKVIFNSKSTANANIIKVAAIKSNKIESDGTAATTFFTNATNGVWLANGTRNITKTVELDGAELKVSPNPTADFLTVDFGSKTLSMKQLNIVDVTGKVVLSQPIATGASSTTVDVHQLTSGTYLIRVNHEQGTLHTKFVKN